MLASPATGPVERVWYSPGGSLLYARTASGRTFQTADFASWSAAPGPVDPPPLPLAVSASRLPEAGARVVPSALQMYAFARNLWRSADGGLTWENLTAYKSQSVVGDGCIRWPFRRSIRTSWWWPTITGCGDRSMGGCPGTG